MGVGEAVVEVVEVCFNAAHKGEWVWDQIPQTALLRHSIQIGRLWLLG